MTMAKYNYSEFLTIKEENVKKSIGNSIRYVKNGITYEGRISNAIETEICENIQPQRGYVDPFIGICVDDKVNLFFNDITIESIEF